MDEICLHPDNVKGWLVTNATLGDPNHPESGSYGIPVFLSTGNNIRFIVDNEIAWQEITEAASGAEESINFQNLIWQVPKAITKFNGKLDEGTPVTGEKLHEIFEKKADNNDISIRVIVCDFYDLHIVDAAEGVKAFFSGSNVNFRLYETLIFEPFHAKFIVVDGTTAYIVGSPIMNEYFDSDTHKIREPRRGPFGWPINQIKVPIHDVNAVIKGPAVSAIDTSFCMYWNHLKPSPNDPDLTPAEAEPDDKEEVALQIVRTTPGKAHEDFPYGETGILEAYQRAIANAEEFIYIEDQYFTSYDLVEALVLRMNDKSNLKVILLLNTKVDIPGYKALQYRLLTSLINQVSNIHASGRLGIFTLWSHESDIPGTSKIIRNYIHSKVAIIDDKWATIGSANTDGTSLNQTQLPLMGDLTTQGIDWARNTQHANPNYPNEQPYRATELNVVIYNGVAGQPGTSAISELRRKLWKEHLGYNSEESNDLGDKSKYKNDWLSLWRTKATEKKDGLLLSIPEVKRPRILEWTKVREEHGETKIFLKDNVGPINSKVEILEEVDGYDFTTGQRR